MSVDCRARKHFRVLITIFCLRLLIFALLFTRKRIVGKQVVLLRLDVWLCTAKHWRETSCRLVNDCFWSWLIAVFSRNCGKVYCYTCSNFFAPVPTQQLAEPVRLCGSCYNQLHQSGPGAASDDSRITVGAEWRVRHLDTSHITSFGNAAAWPCKWRELELT